MTPRIVQRSLVRFCGYLTGFICWVCDILPRNMTDTSQLLKHLIPELGTFMWYIRTPGKLAKISAKAAHENTILMSGAMT